VITEYLPFSLRKVRVGEIQKLAPVRRQRVMLAVMAIKREVVTERPIQRQIIARPVNVERF